MSIDLVGRTIERERLWQQYQAAPTGRFGVVMVAAEPGIGKTRRPRHLADLAAEAKATVL